MRSTTASLVLAIMAWPMVAMALMQFINPPPFGDGDTSKNLIFAEGSTITLAWTEGTPGKATSIALFQLNGTQYMQPFEYVTQSVINVTSFTWLVGTTKNLTFSNMFYMSIFEEGSTSSDGNSHYFNISTKADATTSASGSTSTSISVGSTLLPATTTSAATLASNSVPADNSSSGMTTGAKVGLGVGLGVGLPIAIAFGIGLGWFFLGGRNRKNQTQYPGQPEGPAPPSMQHSSYYNGSYYSEVPQSTYSPPPQQPVEMAQGGPPPDPNKFYFPNPAQELPAESSPEAPQELGGANIQPHTTPPHSMTKTTRTHN